MQTLCLPALQRQRYNKLRHVSPRIESPATLEKAKGVVKPLRAQPLAAHERRAKGGFKEDSETCRQPSRRSTPAFLPSPTWNMDPRPAGRASWGTAFLTTRTPTIRPRQSL